MRERRKPKKPPFEEMIARLQEAMRPQFEKQRAIEEAECPRRLAKLAKMHVSIDRAGGNCPVQIEGCVKGKPFYFRARGAHWSLGIGHDPIRAPDFYTEHAYGSWPDAGWMPLHEAYDFLIDGIIEWRPKLRTLSGSPEEPNP